MEPFMVKLSVVPVMGSVYVPGETAEVRLTTMSEVHGVPGTGFSVKFADIPAGQPDVVSETGELKPASGVTVTAEATPPPEGTVTGNALIVNVGA